jgi:hypothetical protein
MRDNGRRDRADSIRQERKEKEKTRRPPPKAPRCGIDLTKCPGRFLPTATNTITFTARIYQCMEGQGWVFPGPAKRITFTLRDVSNEQGICLNKGSSRNPDLWFPEQPGVEFPAGSDRTVDDLDERTILGRPNPPHRHYQVARTTAAVTEFTIRVRSEDFGAFGWIEATAEDCESIPPRESDAGVACPAGDCCTGPNRVKIPRDDNGNNIADAARQDAGGAPATDDKDDRPTGDGREGDGLSNYEEYRGFFVLENGNREAHIRTDIRRKDLFVYDQDGQGIGYFRRSDLVVHFVARDQLGPAGRNEINFNRGHATAGAQHGLRMRYGGLPGLLGQTVGGPTPGGVTEIVIDRGAHVRPYDIRNTRAHELGHGVGIDHHGEGALLPGRIDMMGGLTSGDMRCVMRYDNHADAWRFTGPPQRDFRNRRRERSGTTFCTSNRGTGTNARPNNRNNTATRGNCRGQIRVNDH